MVDERKRTEPTGSLRVSPRAPLVVAVTLALVIGAGGCGSQSQTRSPGYDAGSSVSFNTADSDPDWSPDGRLIAFSTNRGRSGGIYVIRPDGTAMRRVFKGEASDVDWSPDGTAIAFARKGIYVMRVRNGKPRLVVQGVLSRPTWASNGGELAVVNEETGRYRTYDGWISGSSSAIYIVRLDGSGVRRLLPRYRGAMGDARADSIAALSETEPAWSPDGTRIAFQAGDGVIVTADAKSGRRITISGSGAAYEPAWSPDGSLIAYRCGGDVCVGSDERRVASGGGDPSWSPDSKFLVFDHALYGGTGYFSRPSSLSIVDVNNEELRELTFGPSS